LIKKKIDINEKAYLDKTLLHQGVEAEDLETT
jgi:hypothetical protein